MTKKSTVRYIQQKYSPAQTRRLFVTVAGCTVGNDQPPFSQDWLRTLKHDYISNAKIDVRS